MRNVGPTDKILTHFKDVILQEDKSSVFETKNQRQNTNSILKGAILQEGKS